MKKIYLFFLLSLLPLVADADAVVIDGICYNLNNENHTAEVTSGSYSGSINIPASVTYNSTTYSVTSIGEGAFAFTDIESVHLPEGLLVIEDIAFCFCTSLREINISFYCNTIRSRQFLNSIRWTFQKLFLINNFNNTCICYDIWSPKFSHK